MWLVDSAISMGLEVVAERSLRVVIADAEMRRESRCRSEDLMRDCVRIQIVEPYRWPVSVRLPLYSMTSGLHGIRLASLLNGDRYGAMILYNAEGMVLVVMPVEASLLSGIGTGVRLTIDDEGRTVVARRIG